jgi:hypothetical protein
MKIEHNDIVLRELLSASISNDEVMQLLRTNRGRGVKGGLEKERLRIIAQDARVRLIKAQNAALAALNKWSAK